MRKRGDLQKYNEFVALGSEIAASMVVPLLIGWYIDEHFKTKPWGILAGILFSFLGLFYNIYKLTVQSKDINQKKDGSEEEE